MVKHFDFYEHDRLKIYKVGIRYLELVIELVNIKPTNRNSHSKYPYPVVGQSIRRPLISMYMAMSCTLLN